MAGRGLTSDDGASYAQVAKLTAWRPFARPPWPSTGTPSWSLPTALAAVARLVFRTTDGGATTAGCQADVRSCIHMDGSTILVVPGKTVRRRSPPCLQLCGPSGRRAANVVPPTMTDAALPAQVPQPTPQPPKGDVGSRRLSQIRRGR